MMGVPVWITSCQVSEKPKTGPVSAQASTTVPAVMKAQDRRAWGEAHCAARANGGGSAMAGERRMAGRRFVPAG